MQPDDITSFADVEAAGDPDGFVETLDELSGGLFADATRRGAKALAVKAGDRVLDVGCGTGTFAASVGPVVGPSGEVVGVDLSETMVAEARRRTAGAGSLCFEVADAGTLPFPDSAFDAAHMERVLLYIDRPDAAVSEMLRVTRPGGRLALVEPDIGTWTLDSQDRVLTRRILELFNDLHPGGWAGRSLRGLLLRGGAQDVEVEAATSILTDVDRWEQAFRIEELLGRAASNGVADSDAGARWLRELRSAARQGTFFWSVTLFIASARAS